MPDADREPRIDAVPHRPGRHDVERGELLQPAGMIEREPIGDAAAAVVAGESEAHVAELLHHLDHGVRHAALVVGRMAARRIPARPTSRSPAGRRSPG